MLDKFAQMEIRLAEIDQEIQDPDIFSQQARYAALMKERGRLAKMIEPYHEYQTLNGQLEEARGIVDNPDEDADVKEMAAEEIPDLETQVSSLYEQLEELLVTDDEDATRNVIMEIRAGAGGDEAAIFAGDLFRMYSRFAETRKWKVSVMDAAESEMGGFKQLTCSIEGEDVYKFLQFESGGHRVQRVPETESQGRIHTSLCTVAVLPEAEEIDIEIKKEDLNIGTFRASGPGGQHVNKTDSAIRIVHEPSGVVVECQSERSQHQNKAHAMRMLRAKLYENKMNELKAERDELRRGQIGSGDRSERIRTYNYPQSRVTDHRAGINFGNLQGIMEGGLDTVFDDLLEWDKQERLKAYKLQS